MGNKTPDEILEQQRAEATKAYAETINDLKAQARRLEDKLANLNATLEESFSSKSKELEDLEREARNRISELDSAKAEVAAQKREADSKLQEAAEILNKVKLDKESHSASVESHLNAAEKDRNEIAQRFAACASREDTALQMEQRADLILKSALEKEKEIDEKINDFNSISENLYRNIDEQKAFESKNKAEAEFNKKQKEELEFIKIDYEQKNKDLGIKNEEVESTRASLANRKLEIDEAREDLKQKNIRYSLDMQRLQDKQKDIDSQVGKLNELKNNVEALIKIQESKGA